MSHEPIQLNICTSDIPAHCYWKTQDGKVMLTITVAEKRTPSPKGYTHYGSVFNKQGQTKEEKTLYVGYGKFAPYQQATVGAGELPPTADQLDSGTVSDAEVVSPKNDDLPF